MSVYYETNGGDKDAQDMLSINREDLLRSGADKHLLDDEKRDSGHTLNPFTNARKSSSTKKPKGFGRLHLEKLGWRPGEPVGNPTRNGLVEALDGSDGKPPMDKSGIGYRGVRVDKDKLIQLQKQIRLREHQTAPYYIASKYDQDPSRPDSLLKRFDPTMKYRSCVNTSKKKSSDEKA